MAEIVRVKFTLEQRVFLLKQFYCFDRDYEAIRLQFFERWPDTRFPNHNYLIDLANKFERTGSVQDAPRCGRLRSVRTEENTTIVAQTFIEDPHCSAKRASLKLDIPSRTLRRIMHDVGLHCYRPHLLQELKQQDHLPRVDFCEWYLIMRAANPFFERQILWSDEAQFKVNGRINKHNCVYWSDEHPHEILQREVNSPGVMVWAGINYRGIVGPYFFDGTVNSNTYQQLLHELRVTLDEDERFEGRDIILQQDGAPAHFSVEVRNFLNEHFPDWIGRAGRIAWPPRSPDLTPMDFSIWGIMKNRVYAHPIANVEDLKHWIEIEFDIINEDVAMLSRIIKSIEKRYLKCIEMSGDYFEHLL